MTTAATHQIQREEQYLHECPAKMKKKTQYYNIFMMVFNPTSPMMNTHTTKNRRIYQSMRMKT